MRRQRNAGAGQGRQGQAPQVRGALLLATLLLAAGNAARAEQAPPHATAGVALERAVATQSAALLAALERSVATGTAARLSRLDERPLAAGSDTATVPPPPYLPNAHDNDPLLVKTGPDTQENPS